MRVAAEGARGMGWVAFALCGKSFVEDEYGEEEDASVDDNGGGK